MVSVGSIRRLRVTVDADVDGAVRGLRKVDDEADDAADSMDTMGSRAGDLESQLSGLRTAFMGVGAVTAGLGFAMGKVAQSGMRIDSIFKMVETTSGATASEMDEMRQTAADVGADLPVTMDEVARAFREMSFAGFSAAESMDSIHAVSQLASSGAMSVDESARIVTSTLNQFNLAADQAGNVAASLAGTFSSTATTMPEMSQALEYVGGTAEAAGQDLTQVAGALGVLANAGRRGSKAGTEMQQIMSRLAGPTAKAEEAMTSLGISMSDLTDEQGNFRDFNDIVRTFADNMEGLGSAERLQYLTDIFGERGSRSMAALIDGVEELDGQLNTVALTTIDTAIDQLSNLEGQVKRTREEALGFTITPDLETTDVLSRLRGLGDQLPEEEFRQRIEVGLGVDETTAEYLSGRLLSDEPLDNIASSLDEAVTAADLAEGQMNTVAGQLEYLQGSLESVAYTIYGGFRPALRGILDVATDFVDVLTANEDAAKAFGAALVPVLGGLTTLTGLIGTAYLIQWGRAMYGTAQAAYAFATANFTAANAARALQIAMGPVGWAILAVGAAVTAYMTNFLGFRDWVNGMVEDLQPLTDALMAAANWLLDFGGALFDIIGAIGGLYWGALVSGVEWFADALGSLLGGPAGDAVSWADQFGRLLGDILGPLADLPDQMHAAADTLRNMTLGEAFVRLGTGIMDAVDRIDILREYLEWVDSGGLLSGLLGDFSIVAASIDNARMVLGWFTDGVALARQAWDDLVASASGIIDRYFLRPLSRLDQSLQTIQDYLDTLGLVAENTSDLIERTFNSISDLDDVDIQSALNASVDATVQMTDESKDTAEGAIESWVEGVMTDIRRNPIESAVQIGLTLMFPPLALAWPSVEPIIDDAVAWVEDDLAEPLNSAIVQTLAATLGGPIGFGLVSAYIISESEVIGDAVEYLGSMFDPIAGWLDNKVWKPFKRVFPETAEAVELRVGQVAAAVDALGDAFDGIAGWVDTFITQPAISTINDATAALGDLYDTITSLGDSDAAVDVDIDLPSTETIAAALWTVLPTSVKITVGAAWNLFENWDSVTAAVENHLAPLGAFMVDTLDRSMASLITPTRFVEIWRPWLEEAFALGGDLIDYAVNGITDALPDLGLAGGDVVATFAGGIRGNKQALRTAAVALLSALIPFLPSSNAERGPLSDLYGHGQAVVDTLAAGVRSADVSLTNALKAVLGGLVPYLPSSNANTGPLSDLYGRGQALVETIGEGMRSRKDWIEGLFESVFDVDVDLPSAGDIGQQAAGAAGAAEASLRTGAVDAAGAAAGVADRVRSSLPNQIRAPVDALADVGVSGGGLLGGGPPPLRPQPVAELAGGGGGGGGQGNQTNRVNINVDNSTAVTAEGVADVQQLREEMRQAERRGEERVSKRIGNILDDIMATNHGGYGGGG